MNSVPASVSFTFIATTLLTVFFFYKASRFTNATVVVLLIWLALQGVAGYNLFYTVANTFPPRFLLLILPPLLVIVVLFFTQKGRQYITSFDIKTLTILHIVRIPVELVLYGLFLYKVVPQIMTFEGRNFDVLSGVSAPVIYYFGFVKKSIGKKGLIAWNLVCLCLLINIVVNAVLSAPLPFQQFAFEQPNIAILYFPFIWLPCFVVPLVLFSHLITIYQLVKQKKTNEII